MEDIIWQRNEYDQFFIDLPLNNSNFNNNNNNLITNDDFNQQNRACPCLWPFNSCLHLFEWNRKSPNNKAINATPDKNENINNNNNMDVKLAGVQQQKRLILLNEQEKIELRRSLDDFSDLNVVCASICKSSPNYYMRRRFLENSHSNSTIELSKSSHNDDVINRAIASLGVNLSDVSSATNSLHIKSTSYSSKK